MRSGAMKFGKQTTILLILQTLTIFLRNCCIQCEPEVASNQVHRGQTNQETAFCGKFIRSKGYYCDEHKIYTDDGFELLLHRVGLMHPTSPTASEGGSGDNSDYNRNSLKVGVGNRRRKTRLTSELKLANSVRTSGPIPNDFVAETGAESAQPYQSSGKTDHPFSRSTEVIPIERPNSGSLGGNALENAFQPFTVMNPDVSSSALPFSDSGSPLPTPSSDDSAGTHLPAIIGGIPVTAHGSQPILSPSTNCPTTEATLATPPDWYLPYKRRLPSPPLVRSKPRDYPGPTRMAPPSADQPYSLSLSPEPLNLEQAPKTAPECTSALPLPCNPLSPGLSSPPLPGEAFPPEVSAPPFPSNAFPPELLAPTFPGNSFPPVLSAPPFPGNSVPPELSAPLFPGDSFPPEVSAPPFPGSILPPEFPPDRAPYFVIPITPSTVGPPLVPEAPSPGVDPPTAEDKSGCKVALLLHHELLNGDSWFKEVGLNEPSAFLPFLLVDDGFDVWVGHLRATYWSHDHQRLNNDNHEFWDWTWDEFVQYDVPTTLRYVNNCTQSKAHIVGVSQSAAVVVAAATQPDVARFMQSIVLLGPTIFHGKEAPPFLATWARIFAKVTGGPDSTTVSGQFNISRQFGISNLTLGGPASMISGPDCCISSFVTLFDNGWDGTTSYKNFQHLEQGFFTNTFQHFDYGTAARNRDAYGQPEPVAYLPANMPADLPVQVIHGGNDFFSSPAGIKQLLAQMPGLPTEVYLPTYAHFDLLFSSSRNDDVYGPIRSFLQHPASTI